MKIEKEIRYYFSNTRLNELAVLLAKIGRYSHSYHEVTTMYDNPNPDLTFYSKDVDGRLRVRYSRKVSSPAFGRQSKNVNTSRCLVTWKRRIAHTDNAAIRHEEEVEYSVDASEFGSVKSIFEDVLKCKKVSSYERIRSFLLTDSVQITCDQFPFGLMVEFELKDEGDEQALIDTVKKANLDLSDSSKLSCDDMYFQLCREQGVAILPDISFADVTMPTFKYNYLL